MKHQGISAMALMLIFLLVMAVPARAGVLHFADVVYTRASTGASTDARLRIAPQSGTSTIAPQQSIQRGGAAGTPQQSGANAPAGGSTTPNDATLSQSGGQVETVDLGDVTGTVCDCGEIPSTLEIPGGGFPFWPFIGLVAIPLAFIPGGDEAVPFVIPPPIIPTPVPQPQPQPPSTPVPEPATLLLFGTSLLALGARARRRFSRRDNGAETVAAGEVI